MNGQCQRLAGLRAKTPAVKGGGQHGERNPLWVCIPSLTADAEKAERMRIIIF
jgi:hypothetical protein